MRALNVWKATTPSLVALGFAAGVAFVASCGGSGGGAQAATGGSQAVRHVHHAPVPSVHTVAGFSRVTVETVTFTPANASDVPLGIRVHGNATVTDGSCTLSVDLVVPGFGIVSFGQVGMPVGASQDFTVVAPFPSAGSRSGPQATHDVQVNLLGPFGLPGAPPTTSNVTIHALDVEVIVLQGVDVSDPSPLLQ